MEGVYKKMEKDVENPKALATDLWKSGPKA